MISIKIPEIIKGSLKLNFKNFENLPSGLKYES